MLLDFQLTTYNCRVVMILRQESDSLLFITQPDHARLAADSIAHWQADGFAAHPRREVILVAAREHDNGWIEEDDTTYLGDDGQPLDFVHAPADVRQRLWPRAVERVGRESPYAAALIALHAMTVHSSMRTNSGWSGFFQTMDSLRRHMIERVGGAAPETLEADYKFVHAADRLSLALCTGWSQPLESAGRRIILTGNTVEVSPDPFEGHRIPMRVPARRLPLANYASSAELRAALNAAPVEWLDGWAVGV